MKNAKLEGLGKPAYFLHLHIHHSLTIGIELKYTLLPMESQWNSAL